MKKHTPRALLFSLLTFAFPMTALAQDDADHSATIENALSAATEAIAENASVADWEGNILRQGSNNYTCMPDNPDSEGNDPMCLDQGWLAWVAAWTGGEDPPAVEHISFGYMLQGGASGSNTDPNATEATDDNEWIEYDLPHIMMLVPDIASLEGMNHDPFNGEPYVMWRGTSLAHLMVPTAQRK